VTAEEIFKSSVDVMNRLFPSGGMTVAIKRVKGHSEAENLGLLERKRAAVNELVRQVADAGGAGGPLNDVPEELVDAIVLRYLRNREVFLKTFPAGIEVADPDPISLWAAMMISPLDERAGE
jgi:hypothetical protein